MIIDGTNYDDLIVGTDSNDTINGLWGDDEINAGGGNDLVMGGGGDDIIRGEGGHDTLYDDEGNDQVFGGDGNDLIVNQFGSGGLDILDGGEGNDTINMLRSGMFGHVSAAGRGGDDSFSIIDATGSIFEIDGGDGNDSILIQMLSFNSASSMVALTLGAGADMVLFAQIGGRVVISDFEAGDGGDRLEFAGALQGLTNYDRTSNIFASGHARLLASGSDTLLQIDRDGPTGGIGWTTLVTLTNMAGNAFTAYNLGGYPADGSVPAGVSLTGTAGPDRLFGTMADDILEGGDGRNFLYGGGGNDILRGGAGTDSLYGSFGNDELQGGAGNDFLEDGHGDDVVAGEDGADTLSSNASGSDTLDGGAGNDVISITRNGLMTDIVTVVGGADNDRITINGQSESSFNVDAGSGDDRVTLSALNGAASIALGTGQDRVVLSLFTSSAFTAWGDVKIVDFETGDGADMFDFNGFLRVAAPGWDLVTNPFSNGFARLVQKDGEAVLEISNNADPANFRPVVTFLDAVTSSFTAWNLFGWPVDGSPPPGLVLTGTALGDTIDGTAGPDTIEGLDGQDSLSGGAGNDTVRGGNGADSLRGGAGDDLIEGGEGDDRLDGDAGSDEVRGGAGNDTILAGPTGGADRLYGEEGNDLIQLSGVPALASGGGGDDYIEVFLPYDATGAGTLLGGDGRDSIAFIVPGLAGFTVDGGSGDDMIWNLPFNAGTSVTLGAGRDLITFEGRHPTERSVVEIVDFTAGDGGDYLDLSTLLYYPAGPTDFESSALTAGFVRLVQEGSDTLVQLDLDGPGTAHGFVTTLILRNTVAAELTAGNIGYGTDGADMFRLDVGQDVTGAGHKGNDLYFLGAHLSPRDYLDGGLGIDRVVIQGDYSQGLVLEESTLTEIESLVLLSGTDPSFGGSGTELYDYFLTLHDENVEPGATLTVYFKDLKAGEDVIFDGRAETDGRFVVIGGGGDDVIAGGAGNDSLDGGLGTDALAGGAGNDVYFVDAGDIVLELVGEGTDEIRTALGSRVDPAQMYVLPENVENLTGTAAGAQGVYGNALDNRIRMGAGGDLVVLDGGGDDRVESGGGNDFLYYGAAFTAADRNDGGAGFDTVGLLGVYDLTLGAGSLVGIEKLALYSSGNAAAPNGYRITTVDANVAAGTQLMVVAQSLLAGETFSFNGSAETDGSFNVRGGRGSDTIVTGAGADRLYGGLGADLLTGGAGADIFEYRAVADSTALARDTIQDFGAGDVINLFAIDPDGIASNGNGKFSFVGSNAFSGKAGELRLVGEGATWLVEADTDGDREADFAIVVHTVGGHALTGSDFLF